MAAEAPLVFYLLLFFPFVKGSSQPSPQSDHTTDGIIHLTTSDGDLIAMNQAILYESNIIKREICNGRAGNTIKLENTTSRALDKLIYYLQNFNQTEFAISKWKKDLRENYQVLFELLLAGNELKIESVVNMAAGIISDMMRSKSPAEIRRMFNCGRGDRDEKEEEQEMLPFYLPLGEPEEVRTRYIGSHELSKQTACAL